MSTGRWLLSRPAGGPERTVHNDDQEVGPLAWHFLDSWSSKMPQHQAKLPAQTPKSRNCSGDCVLPCVGEGSEAKRSDGASASPTRFSDDVSIAFHCLSDGTSSLFPS